MAYQHVSRQLHECEDLIDLASLADSHQNNNYDLRRQHFPRTVLAIHHIVDSKLYKARKPSLEAYFKDRFQISRAQVYRFMDSALVLQVRVHTCACMGQCCQPCAADALLGQALDNVDPVPCRERQCRAIKKVTKTRHHRRALWLEVLEKYGVASADTVTSTQIEQVWRDLVRRRVVDPDDPEDEPYTGASTLHLPHQLMAAAAAASATLPTGTAYFAADGAYAAPAYPQYYASSGADTAPWPVDVPLGHQRAWTSSVVLPHGNEPAVTLSYTQYANQPHVRSASEGVALPHTAAGEVSAASNKPLPLHAGRRTRRPRARHATSPASPAPLSPTASVCSAPADYDYTYNPETEASLDMEGRGVAAFLASHCAAFQGSSISSSPISSPLSSSSSSPSALAATLALPSARLPPHIVAAAAQAQAQALRAPLTVTAPAVATDEDDVHEILSTLSGMPSAARQSVCAQHLAEDRSLMDAAQQPAVLLTPSPLRTPNVQYAHASLLPAAASGANEATSDKRVLLEGNHADGADERGCKRVQHVHPSAPFALITPKSSPAVQEPVHADKGSGACSSADQRICHAHEQPDDHVRDMAVAVLAAPSTIDVPAPM